MGVYHYRHSGFVWLVFWLMIYRRPEEHPRLSTAELAYIQSDPAEPTTKIPWPVWSAPADMGICHWQIHDRSDLVGLSFLDAEISEH